MTLYSPDNVMGSQGVLKPQHIFYQGFLTSTTLTHYRPAMPIGDRKKLI